MIMPLAPVIALVHAATLCLQHAHFKTPLDYQPRTAPEVKWTSIQTACSLTYVQLPAPQLL